MKNILITGVSKGIGRTFAKHFHSLGFTVYGGYKWSSSYKEEEPLAESLQAELQNLILLPYDLADRTLLEQLTQQMHGIQLEAIINNAGEFLANNFDNLNLESWDRSIAVHMTAPLLLAFNLRHNLVKNASIVNIASTDAFYAAYDDLGYAASKAGLISITKSMAAALAHKNIRVNAVAPGWVDTEMAENANINEFAQFQTPLGRNATTQEITNVVAFLVSPQSSFVNASVITVDGGYSSIDYVIKKEAGH
ncbi:MAG TPA: SDR family oxidoreductase [Candidatus Saccharimonadales bacterium]|nr:SDR family oxidoreductase [Candidatus Saccharimonadales bacterium]